MKILKKILNLLYINEGVESHRRMQRNVNNRNYANSWVYPLFPVLLSATLEPYPCKGR